jgi:hypothetical protein
VRAKEPFNVPDADNWLLNQWIDIELPGIASLTPDELVSIRTQSEEFEQWRRALKDAVRWADAAPRTLLDRRSHVKREVQERLEEGKNELESSMPKSTLLKGLKKGSVSMLGGAVSAALVFWLDPTRTLGAALAGLAGAAGSAAISAAEEGLKGEREFRQARDSCSLRCNVALGGEHRRSRIRPWIWSRTRIVLTFSVSSDRRACPCSRAAEDQRAVFLCSPRGLVEGGPSRAGARSSLA